MISLKFDWPNLVPINKAATSSPVSLQLASIVVVERESGGSVDSVNGKTGVVVLNADDVGADIAGSALAVREELQPQITTNTDAVAMLVALLSALQASKADLTYVNDQIANLVSTDTQTLATIQAITDALAENEGLLEALDQTVANRVRFEVATQGLTALQKYNARTNIGAEEIGTAALLINQITAASIGAVTAAQLATVATTGSYNDLTNKPNITGTLLTGLTTVVASAITATDSVIGALAKLQASIETKADAANTLLALGLKQDKLPTGTAGQFLAHDLTFKTPSGGGSGSGTSITVIDYFPEDNSTQEIKGSVVVESVNTTWDETTKTISHTGGEYSKLNIDSVNCIIDYISISMPFEIGSELVLPEILSENQNNTILMIIPNNLNPTEAYIQMLTAQADFPSYTITVMHKEAYSPGKSNISMQSYKYGGVGNFQGNKSQLTIRVENAKERLIAEGVPEELHAEILSEFPSNTLIGLYQEGEFTQSDGPFDQPAVLFVEVPQDSRLHLLQIGDFFSLGQDINIPLLSQSTQLVDFKLPSETINTLPSGLVDGDYLNILGYCDLFDTSLIKGDKVQVYNNLQEVIIIPKKKKVFEYTKLKYGVKKPTPALDITPINELTTTWDNEVLSNIGDVPYDNIYSVNGVDYLTYVGIKLSIDEGLVITSNNLSFEDEVLFVGLADDTNIDDYLTQRLNGNITEPNFFELSCNYNGLGEFDLSLNSSTPLDLQAYNLKTSTLAYGNKLDINFLNYYDWAKEPKEDGIELPLEVDYLNTLWIKVKAPEGKGSINNDYRYMLEAMPKVINKFYIVVVKLNGELEQVTSPHSFKQEIVYDTPVPNEADDGDTLVIKSSNIKMFGKLLNVNDSLTLYNKKKSAIIYTNPRELI